MAAGQCVARSGPPSNSSAMPRECDMRHLTGLSDSRYNCTADGCSAATAWVRCAGSTNVLAYRLAVVCLTLHCMPILWQCAEGLDYDCEVTIRFTSATQCAVVSLAVFVAVLRSASWP
jgi:hypothetical protein